MRDLGSMGESTFKLWCAQVNLICNRSEIDKTGWDFSVEFPFCIKADTTEIHKAAIGCKVQVKATDKATRKLPIKLSNLRRLITDPLPTFFIFIEFDGERNAKKAFVLHVDSNLISKVLKKLHETQQLKVKKKFNKVTMTLNYDDTHLMKSLDGNCLKTLLLNYIGDDMAEYVAQKKSHLNITGFEEGSAYINFTVKDAENIKKLIDTSIGLEKEVDISNLKIVQTRFGIPSKEPSIDIEEGKIQIFNPNPITKGLIQFKEDKLSAGLSFEVSLHISPFNFIVPNEFKKVRIQGEFFEIIFNPKNGSANFLFSFGTVQRLRIKDFRDAIKLINLLTSGEKNIYSVLTIENFPKLEFKASCKDIDIKLSSLLEDLNCLVNLIHNFDMTERDVRISFNELSTYKMEISQFAGITGSSKYGFWVEFSVDKVGFDLSKEVAYVYSIFTPIGSHIFGILIVLIGKAELIEKDKYKLVTKEYKIEKKIVLEADKPLNDEELDLAKEVVGEKYLEKYSVVINET